MQNQAFKEVMEDGILGLSMDIKSFLRIVEDPHLEDEQRTLAAGAILHVLSASNAIPGMRGTLAFVDDIIVMRLVLERLTKQAPDVMKRHRESSPDLLEPLEEVMQITRAYLGDLLTVLDKAVDTLHELTHEGQTPKDCASGPEGLNWLYDAVHAAIVDDLDFDEGEVTRALRKVDQIRRPLELRLAAT